MKDNCGPESYAEEPKLEVRREKNQDNGEIIETERTDQANRCAALIVVARWPAGDS
jgi:hypothetical protein